MQRRLVPVCALALGLVAAGTAGAQDLGATRAVSFGIAAGATMPTGDYGDFFGTGFNVMGTLGVQPAFMPAGVRFDVAYHSLPGEDVFGEDGEDATILSGTANVLLSVSNTGGMRPYLIGGVGLYRLDAGGDETPTEFGLNGGGGIEFGLAGFSTFVEARFHSVFTDDEGEDFGNLNLVPIVFGLRF